MKLMIGSDRNRLGRSRALAMAAVACAVVILPLQAQPSLVVRARGMIDVESGRLIENATVVVKGELFSLSGDTPERVSALQAHMRRAVAEGLPIAFGTDAGVIPHGANTREFEHLASIGLDAASALRAATLSAASAVGMPRNIGVLSEGRLADVIGVEGNPLADVRTLQRVSFVMKDGKTFEK